MDLNSMLKKNFYTDQDFFKRLFITEKNFVYLVAAIILFFFIWQDYSLLFQTPVATGIDGYYYVLQVNSLINSGHLYFHTNTPLVLYFLAVWAYFIGKTIIAIKLGAIGIQILMCFGIAYFLQTLTENKWLAICGIFLASYTILQIHFLSEFVNNFGALMFLIWAILGAVKANKKKSKGWWIFFLLMLSAAVFSHRSIAGIFFFVFFTLLLAKIGIDFISSNNQRLIYGLIIAFLFILPYFLACQSIITFPDWLSSEFLRYPENPFRIFILIEMLMMIIVLICTVTLFLSKPELFRGNLRGLILVSILLWNILIILNPFLNHQAGITGIVARLDLIIYLQLAIALPCLLSLLPFSKKLVFATVMLFSVAFAFNRLIPLPLGLQKGYLETRQKLADALPFIKPRNCENPFIVARHGDQFLVTAALSVESQKTLPLEKQTQCVFWLIRQPKTNYQIIFENSQLSPDGNFILVDDNNIQRDFNNSSSEERRLLIQENPQLKNLSKNLAR